MSLGINVIIKGDAALIKKLDNLGSTLIDWKEALDETGKNLSAYFAGQVFASHGGVWGTRRGKLCQQQHRLQRSVIIRNTLQCYWWRTGQMQGSFTHFRYWYAS